MGGERPGGNLIVQRADTGSVRRVGDEADPVENRCLFHCDRDAAHTRDIDIQSLGTRMQLHDDSVLILQVQTTDTATQGDTRFELGISA